MNEIISSSGAAPPDPARRRSDRGRKLVQILLHGDRPYMLYIAFAILLVIFSTASPWFLSIDNFLNIGRQTARVSIIAIGMTFVIIGRQIDLSVGSTLALSGMCAALAMQYVANNWLLGAVVGLGAGALVGLINGALTTRLSIPSFLVTLGTLSAARGLALMLTSTKPVIITNETYFSVFGEGYFEACRRRLPGRYSPPSSEYYCSTIASMADRSTRRAAIRPPRSIPAFISSA
jgi:ribose/xylose/arabinose/galactoside ABC-type transport system permease subunit